MESEVLSLHISLPQLLDLALGTPEVGSVNFNVLHNFLHVLLHQMNLKNTKVEYRGEEANKIKTMITSWKAEPSLYLHEYSIIDDTGKREKREVRTDGTKITAEIFTIDLADSRRSSYADRLPSAIEDKPESVKSEVDGEDLQKSSESVGSSISAKETKGFKTTISNATDSPRSSIVFIEPSVDGVLPTALRFKVLEDSVKKIQERFKALEKLSSNSEMIEHIRTSRTDPLNDMWHTINMNKRLDAAEEAIEKLSTMLHDLIKTERSDDRSKEVDSLIERVAELETSLTAINDDILNIQSNVSGLMSTTQRSEDAGEGTDMEEMDRGKIISTEQKPFHSAPALGRESVIAGINIKALDNDVDDLKKQMAQSQQDIDDVVKRVDELTAKTESLSNSINSKVSGAGESKVSVGGSQTLIDNQTAGPSQTKISRVSSADDPEELKSGGSSVYPSIEKIISDSDIGEDKLSIGEEKVSIKSMNSSKPSDKSLNDDHKQFIENEVIDIIEQAESNVINLKTSKQSSRSISPRQSVTSKHSSVLSGKVSGGSVGGSTPVPSAVSSPKASVTSTPKQSPASSPKQSGASTPKQDGASSPKVSAPSSPILSGTATPKRDGSLSSKQQSTSSTPKLSGASTPKQDGVLSAKSSASTPKQDSILSAKSSASGSQKQSKPVSPKQSIGSAKDSLRESLKELSKESSKEGSFSAIREVEGELSEKSIRIDDEKEVKSDEGASDDDNDKLMISESIRNLEKVHGDAINDIELRLSDLEEKMKDVNDAVGELKTSEGRGDLPEIQELANKIQDFQSELDRMNQTAIKLEEKEKEDSHKSLLEEIELLKTIKADKEELEDALADKADIRTVKRKVSYDRFDESYGDLARNVENAIAKLTQKESIWQQALDSVQEEVDNKLDKVEVSPIKDFVNTRVQVLQDKLRELTEKKRENEAAGAKKIITGLNCISCDSDAIMKIDDETPIYKDPMPYRRSLQPYLAFKMDKVRRLQKIPEKMNPFSSMTDPGRKFKGPGKDNIENILISKDHLCNRYCSGDQTNPLASQTKAGKTGHFFDQWGPKMVELTEGVLQGPDGQYYFCKRMSHADKGDNNSKQNSKTQHAADTTDNHKDLNKFNNGMSSQRSVNKKSVDRIKESQQVVTATPVANSPQN